MPNFKADVNDDAFGEAAYCHHRHHPDEGHSSNFDTCQHSICISARKLAALAEWTKRVRLRNEELESKLAALPAEIDKIINSIQTIYPDELTFRHELRDRLRDFFENLNSNT